MVRSRAIPPFDGDQLALVPLLDLIKHARSPNAKISVASSGNPFFGKSRNAVIEATRAIRKGEAISTDFGPGKLDSSILIDHGAIDASNSRAGYSLSLSLDPQDRNADDKIDILELNGFPAVALGQGLSFRIGTDASSPVGPDMMAFLRLSFLSGT